jgi:hypothetical protein
MLVLSACSSDDGGEDTQKLFVPLDPEGIHYDKTYGEWGAAWWTWIFELPPEEMDPCKIPIEDSTGAWCAVGQKSDSNVFFLAGAWANGTTVVRDECKAVRADQAIFFPVLTGMTDCLGVEPPCDPAANKKQLDAWLESVEVEKLFTLVDGAAVAHLERYRAGPTEFSYSVPAAPNAYTCGGDKFENVEVTQAYSVGYWILLPPLSRGAHEIRFGAAETLDVTFRFTVE